MKESVVPTLEGMTLSNVLEANPKTRPETLRDAMEIIRDEAQFVMDDLDRPAQVKAEETFKRITTIHQNLTSIQSLLAVLTMTLMLDRMSEAIGKKPDRD